MKRSFSRKPVPALFTAAEKSPPDAAFVVLGFRKCQRQKNYVAFVRQFPGLRRQFRRPVRIIDEVLFFLAGDAVNGFTLAEFYDLFQDLIRQHR